MKSRTNKSCTYKIWMAGDVTRAKTIVRKYCDKIGDCYAVTSLDYIYTDGEAAGFCVSRIQYPRFPISEADILKRTNELAKLLCEGLCQKSYTVEGPSNTVWFSGDDVDCGQDHRPPDGRFISTDKTGDTYNENHHPRTNPNDVFPARR